MSKIWERHFFIELIKMFIFFIACLYFLYVLIDYSAHARLFHEKSISFFKIFLYYIFQFTKRAEVLIPVALMVATIKVLTTANQRREVVALVTCGVPLKRILYPFLLAAAFSALLLYANYEFLHPFSLNRISSFEEHYFKDRGSARTRQKVNALTLADGSLLLYQSYDQEKKEFFDVFWMRTPDTILRIQSLLPHADIPSGKYVDFLNRTATGEMIKQSSIELAFFPDMHFDSHALFNAVHPPRMQSITQLTRQLVGKQTGYGMGKMTDKEAELTTFFYYKLTMPLICFLSILGPAFYCLIFTRNLPVFFIYAVSLASIVIFLTCVNASVICGQNQLLPPLLAILLPYGVCFSFIGWKYANL